MVRKVDVMLLSGYPRSRISRDLKGICRFRVRELAIHYALIRSRRRRLASSLLSVLAASWDSWAKGHACDGEIFHSLSGWGVASSRHAHRGGTAVVCDRGSTHIQHQFEVLKVEAKRWDVEIELPAKGIIRREVEHYALADRIFVPSEFVRRTFIDRGVPPETLLVIPYGVDLSMFRPYDKHDQALRVTFCGQVSLRKGIPYLVEAARALSRKIEVVLIGPEVLETKELLRDAPDNVSWSGPLSRNDLARAFSQSSLFVMPSVEEGLALVILQAMACGLPVIATPETGAEQVITDGVEGLIVPSRDARALATSILTLLDDDDRRASMGQAAARRVAGMGGWVDYGARVLAAYDELCGGGSR